MKKKLLIILSALLFISAFNLFFFLGQTVLNPISWYVYGFIHLAFLSLLLTPVFAKGTRTEVLVSTLWLNASLYFIMALCLGVYLLCCNPLTLTWSIILQGFIFVVFFIWQIFNVLANDATESSLQEQEQLSMAKQNWINILQTQLSKTESTELKEKIEQCIDSIRAMPIQTFMEVKRLEAEIGLYIERLQEPQLCENEDASKQLLVMIIEKIKERNLILEMCLKKY